MSLKRFVALAFCLPLLCGSGRSRPVLPLEGLLQSATAAGQICVVVSGKNVDAAYAPGQSYLLGRKTLTESDRCTNKVVEVESPDIWLEHRSGVKVRPDAESGSLDLVPGENEVVPSTSGFRLRIRVAGQKYTVVELADTKGWGMSVDVVRNQAGTLWGVRATAIYGNSMCPSTGQEVLAWIDVKAGKIHRPFHAFDDQHRREPGAERTLRNVTEATIELGDANWLLRNAKTLRSLSVSFEEPRDLSFLPLLKRLETLSIDGPVKSVEPLLAMKSLGNLALSFHGLGESDLERIKKRFPDAYLFDPNIEEVREEEEEDKDTIEVESVLD